MIVLKSRTEIEKMAAAGRMVSIFICRRQDVQRWIALRPKMLRCAVIVMIFPVLIWRQRPIRPPGILII